MRYILHQLEAFICVVWDTNRIMVKMKSNCSIFSLSLHSLTKEIKH